MQKELTFLRVCVWTVWIKVLPFIANIWGKLEKDTVKPFRLYNSFSQNICVSLSLLGGKYNINTKYNYLALRVNSPENWDKMCPVGLWKIKQQEHGIIFNNTIKFLPAASNLSLGFETGTFSRVTIYRHSHDYFSQCIFYPVQSTYIVFIRWQQLMLFVFVLINKTPDFLFSYCEERGGA